MTYTPPKVWTWDSESGGKFASINRPISGATHDKDLPTGKHQLQLHSLATPNGVKVTVMLEELLEAGYGADYDAWFIDINEGDQFSSGFVDVQGSAPYLGGGFGHFYAYAPEKFEYPINRFTMETKRQLDVLDKNLEDNRYLAGDEYTIADMATAPWYGSLVKGLIYDAAEFIDAASYEHVNRWADDVMSRPAYKRGKMVNRTWGEEDEQLKERHDASDFDK